VCNIGAYESGSDSEIDEAIELMPIMKEFLQQGINESRDFDTCLEQLFAVLQSTSMNDSGAMIQNE